MKGVLNLKCKKCGKEFDIIASFCPYCGSSTQFFLKDEKEEKAKAYGVLIGSAVVYGIYYLGLGRLIDICMKGSGTFSDVARSVLTSGIGVIIVYALFMIPMCYLPWKSVQWSDGFWKSRGIRFFILGGIVTVISGIYVIITKFSDMPLMFLIYGVIVLAGGISLYKKKKNKKGVQEQDEMYQVQERN